MRILVACEESQAVTIELRKRGHTAFSCDIEPCPGGHPEWHLQQDVLPLLKNKWDMIIAFPPCTDLAASGARYWQKKKADGRQQQAIDFFMHLNYLARDREFLHPGINLFAFNTYPHQAAWVEQPVSVSPPAFQPP